MKFKKIVTALAGGVFILAAALGIAACGDDGDKHSLKFVEGTAATCTAEGVKEHYECEDDGCGKYFSDSEGKDEIQSADVVIPKLPHTITAVAAVEPTCTQEGMPAHYKCSVCQSKFDDAEGKNAFTGTPIAKTEHKMKEVPAVTATTTQKGMKAHWICENEPGVYYADQAGTRQVTKAELETDMLVETIKKIDGVLNTEFYNTANAYVIGNAPQQGGNGFVVNTRLAEDGLYIHAIINHNNTGASQSVYGYIDIAVIINDGASFNIPGDKGYMGSNCIVLQVRLNGKHGGATNYDSYYFHTSEGTETNFTTVWECFYSYKSLSEANGGVYENAFNFFDGKVELKPEYSVFMNAIGAMTQGEYNGKDDEFYSDGDSICADKSGNPRWWFWYKQGYGDWYTGEKMYRVSEKGCVTEFERISDNITVSVLNGQHATMTSEESEVVFGDSVTFEVIADEGYRISGVRINGKMYPVRKRAGKYVCSVTTSEVLAWNQTTLRAIAVAVEDNGDVAEDETLLFDGFASEEETADIFDAYGEGGKIEQGVYSFATGKNAMILSKKSDFTDFTLDVRFNMNSNIRGASWGDYGAVNNDVSEIGFLLRASGASATANDITEGLNGMLVGLGYVQNKLVVSYGYYIDGMFQKAGTWDADWATGFKPRELRLVVKGSVVAVIIDEWQAFTLLNKFTSSGSVGVISKGYAFTVDNFTVSSAPSSIYPAITREQWRKTKTIDTGKAFADGQWHSFDMTVPEKVNGSDIIGMWLYRRADNTYPQTATVELNGNTIDGWLDLNGAVSGSGDIALAIPKSQWRNKKLSFKISSTSPNMFDADYYWLVYETQGGKFVADSLDVGIIADEDAHNFKFNDATWQSFFSRDILVTSFQIISARSGEGFMYVTAPTVTAEEEYIINKPDDEEITVDLEDYIKVLPTGFYTDTQWLVNGFAVDGTLATFSESGEYTVSVIIDPISFKTYSDKVSVAFDPISLTVKFIVTLNTSPEPQSNILNKSDVADKTLGAWVGSVVGTYLGLETETQFLDNPNPATELNWNLGCCYTSDDDSNVELMFLHMFEIYGIDNVAFEDMTEEWITHCQNYVWCSNLVARDLMLNGMSPALTGKSDVNWGWQAIDAQIECEIFGYIAPGMLRSTYDRAKFWLTPVADGTALENAAYYAMMCSQAYFEDDIFELLRKVSAASLDFSDGASAETVSIVNFVYNAYLDVKDKYLGGDQEAWREVRAKICDKYYTNHSNKSSVGAQINFASTIMALIFGGDDFEEVGRIAALSGWDNDCNAATACTIWGCMHGYSKYPEFIKKFSENGDGLYYMNSRRVGLSGDTFNNIVKRTMAQAENVIRANGGTVTADKYEVKDAPFTPKTYNYREYYRTVSVMTEGWTGNGFNRVYLPEKDGDVLLATQSGATLEFAFSGTSVQVFGTLNQGGGEVEIFVDGISYGVKSLYCDLSTGINDEFIRIVENQTLAKIRNLPNSKHVLKIVVRTAGQVIIEGARIESTLDEYLQTITPDMNIALSPFANAFCNIQKPIGGGNKDIQVIRNGQKLTEESQGGSHQFDSCDYSASHPEYDYYGIDFGNNTFKFGKIVFTEGGHWWDGGWFKDAVLNETLYVEVRDANGNWTKVNVSIDKAYPNGDKQSLFGNWGESYTFTLTAPIQGTAIRLCGKAGGEHRFTSCSEFEVYIAE